MNLLSDRIKLVLSEHPELDQAKLGVIAGESRGLVNHWHSGAVKSINLSAALAIEQVLHYNHIWLMQGTGDKMIERSRYDTKITHLVNIIQQMEPLQLDQFTKIAEAIIGKDLLQPTAPQKQESNDQIVEKMGKLLDGIAEVDAIAKLDDLRLQLEAKSNERKSRLVP